VPHIQFIGRVLPLAMPISITNAPSVRWQSDDKTVDINIDFKIEGNIVDVWNT
jgi:hypothetical protein